MGLLRSIVGLIIKFVLSIGLLAGSVWVAVVIMSAGPVGMGELAGVVQPGNIGLQPSSGTPPEQMTVTCERGRVDLRATPRDAHAFAGETLVVGVETEAEPWDGFVPDLREALGYWEQNSTRYAGYEVEFELRPNASGPDILVRTLAEVPGGTLGRALRVESEFPRFDQYNACIQADISERRRVRVIKHEVGHLLGLTHADEPQDIMGPDVYTSTETDTATPANSTQTG